MKLLKTWAQYGKGDNLQSSITICVDYDPQDDSVGIIEYVTAYDFKTGVSTDITHIMAESLNLDEIVEAVDWREIYQETKEYKIA